MKKFFRNFYYSFPVQLLLLHFRKYQVVLVFWYILTSTIDSNFMKNFGADALFLSPEYLGTVNALGSAIVGIATAVFIMSWNITTFILHSRRYRFLATTSKPFLKYCLNNSILPLAFLLFYFIKAYDFTVHKELMSVSEFLINASGFIGGFILLIAFSFAYFFGADRTILRTMAPMINDPKKYMHIPPRQEVDKTAGMQVLYYLSNRLKFKKVRNVAHYSQEFLDTVFKRHHFAAMISVLMAFIFLITVGFFLDNRLFQVPAAASIIVLFAIMIAVIGALAYFLQTWSLLFVILLFITLDSLYRFDLIDPRNKAYGINYQNIKDRPQYTNEALLQLCTPAKIAADKDSMIRLLNNWKARQKEEKPVMVFVNISGGGVRSAAFAMNTLQALDSITGGNFMQRTILISGASGGMLSGAYYRELYREKQKGREIKLLNPQYADDISGDLLNPIFSSMIARDLVSPAQKFSIGTNKYVKDRGYAFEQKLNSNTRGLLNRNVGDYISDEKAGIIPMMIFNSVVTLDGRKVMICAQPLSFMMQSGFKQNDSLVNIPDAIDFASMFAKQDPLNMRLLTALRMNATFPYILPNVWLPSNPVIDVMDAGLRDNFGQETSLRFINVFKDWIKANTSRVVIIQIRDRARGGWEQPYESNGITGMLTKPATILQHNWYKLQDYSQNDQVTYAGNMMDSTFQRISFIYMPLKEDKAATLNFHLTASEKKEVIASLKRKNNMDAFQQVKEFVK